MDRRADTVSRILVEDDGIRTTAPVLPTPVAVHRFRHPDERDGVEGMQVPARTDFRPDPPFALIRHDDDYHRARTPLDSLMPAGSARDLRGLEWYVFDQ
jgi:hypothetical protein